MKCQNCLVNDLYKQLDEFIDTCEDKAGSLIAVLHKAQGLFGYLPSEVQEHIAKKLGISTASVYGVVSFYSFFTMTPKGKYPISVCMGTACYVRGAENVLNAFKDELGIDIGQTTKDGKFSLDALRCVGACGLAPIALIGDKVYGKISGRDEVKKILSEYN